MVRLTLEYGGEVWEGNKAQAAALESVMTGGAKRILGCSSSNEAVRGDMGLDPLQGQRDKALCQSISIQGSFLCRSGMSSHVEVGKGSIGVRLSTICFLHWAFIRQSGYIEDIRKGSCSLLRGRSKITYWPAVIHDQRIRR